MKVPPDATADFFKKSGFVAVRWNRTGGEYDPSTGERLPPRFSVPVNGTATTVTPSEPPVLYKPVIETEASKQRSGMVVQQQVVKYIEAEPESITGTDLKVLAENTALLRTSTGDVLYQLYGVDCTNSTFVVLYLNTLKVQFKPKVGKFYYLGLKVQTDARQTGIKCVKVYYSGILFSLPGQQLSVLIFHVA